MSNLEVRYGENKYIIHVTKSFDGLVNFISRDAGSVCIITDSNVEKHYYRQVQSVLNLHDFRILKYIINPGEQSKNLDTVTHIYNYLITNNFSRDDVVIALGGGVVGDVAGFAAATFKRGVSVVQVPTSLLAQVDSSIGSKVGVNHMGIKNSIGAFYSPSLVYINTDVLKTLPKRQLISGLAEVIIHSLIDSEELFCYLEDNVENIVSLDDKVISCLIRENCCIKKKYVELDEKDKNLRKYLNFGHTYGHAIESFSDYEMLHGECVSVGSMAAYKMGEYLGHVNDSQTQRVKKLFTRFGLPVSFKELNLECNPDQLINIMRNDKKVDIHGINFILPVKIGKVIKQCINDADLIKSILLQVN